MLFLFIISVINIDTSNEFIAKKFVQKISNMNWLERKFINGLSPDEIKNKLFYQEDEINKFISQEKCISKENEDNQIIYLFQAKKDIKEKIDIIKKIIDKYQEDPNKIESIIKFCHFQLEDLQAKIIHKEHQIKKDIIQTAHKIEKKIIPHSKKEKSSTKYSEKQDLEIENNSYIEIKNSTTEQCLENEPILYIDTNFFTDIIRNEVIFSIKNKFYKIIQKIKVLFN